MSEWISVKDRLPNELKVVLVYINRTGYYDFAMFDGRVWLRRGGIISKNAISHWMPLAKPKTE